MASVGSTDQFRLFVAIPVPDSVRTRLLAVQRELQSAAPPGAIRWTKPEQIHLTLRFLGDVPLATIPVLQESVRAVCAGARGLSLCARGVGFFPNARSPRVVWVGVNDNADQLVNFQRNLESAVRSFSAKDTGEQFTGHVTLGRFKPDKHLITKDLINCAGTMKDRIFGEWTALEIAIIRSELSATGSRYTTLTSIPLGTEIAPR